MVRVSFICRPLPPPAYYSDTHIYILCFIQALIIFTSSPFIFPQNVRGSFIPQITALPTAAPITRAAKAPPRNVDIIDILSGKTRTPSLAAKPSPGLSASVNVFSVTVPKGEEKRAQIFLGRVKTVLESEPGRLVL